MWLPGGRGAAMGGWMLAALVLPCCSVAGGALRARFGSGRARAAWYALLLRPDGDRDGAGDSVLLHDSGGGSSLPRGSGAAAPALSLPTGPILLVADLVRIPPGGIS